MIKQYLTLRYAFLMLLFLPWTALGQTPFSYIISGRIGAVPATVMLYLRSNGNLLDSTYVHNGRFEFHGTSQQPKRVQLLLASNGILLNEFRNSNRFTNDFRELFIEETPIVINGPGRLSQATISAGPINKEYQLFTSQWAALQDKLRGRWPVGNGVRIETLTSHQRERPYFQQLIKTFIQEHPASWVSLDLLEQRRLGPAQYNEVAPLYAILSPKLRYSEAGKTYKKLVDSLRTVSLGAIAPDLTLTTPNGKRVSVNGYRGKYLLLLFWSSSCECSFELKPTQEVCRRYADDSWAILNVSLDDEHHRKQWMRAINDYQLPGTHASDLGGMSGRAAQRYRLDSSLQNFLLDPTGHILAVNLYGEDLAGALTKYLPTSQSNSKNTIRK